MLNIIMSVASIRSMNYLAIFQRETQAKQVDQNKKKAREKSSKQRTKKIAQ